MGPFAEFGSNIETMVAGFAESTSASVIAQISPIIFTGVVLYFTLKGWMFLTGRADGAISDSVISAFKIALVSFMALNAGNFVSFGIGFISGVEGMMVSSISGDPDVWASIDKLWSQLMTIFERLWKLPQELFGIVDYLPWEDGMQGTFLFFVLALLFCIAAVIITLMCVGVFIMSKLCLAIVLGFGPLFMCTLMFPLTRSWFDGWLKTCLTNVFTLVMAVALIALVGQIFETTVDKIEAEINNSDSGAYMILLGNVLIFLIVALAMGYLFRALPSMASGLIGGVGISAVSLLDMVKPFMPQLQKTADSLAPNSTITNSTLLNNTANNTIGTGRADRALNAALASPYSPKASQVLTSSSGLSAAAAKAAILSLPYKSLGVSTPAASGGTAARSATSK